MARMIDADALLMHIADLGFENRPIEGDSVFVRTRKMTELFCLNFAEALIRNAPTTATFHVIDKRTGKEEDAPTVDAIPLTAMAKWLAGYAAPPNDIMRDFFRSGAEITRESLTAAWEMALRGIDWEGSP